MNLAFNSKHKNTSLNKLWTALRGSHSSHIPRLFSGKFSTLLIWKLHQQGLTLHKLDEGKINTITQRKPSHRGWRITYDSRMGLQWHIKLLIRWGSWGCRSRVEALDPNVVDLQFNEASQCNKLQIERVYLLCWLHIVNDDKIQALNSCWSVTT